MYKKIRSEWMQARKDKDSVKANLLSTLIGEIDTVAKNDGQREPNDGDCLAKLKAFSKNLNSTAELGMSAIGLKEHWDKLQKEIAIIESFLPQQMTEDELYTAIQNIAEEVEACTLRDLGKIMGGLKKQYDGQYDGKMASVVARRYLTEPA